MSEVAVKNEIQISNLKTKIWEAHEEFMHSMKDTLDAGIKAGELLVQVKEEIPHGEFIPWIEQNLPFTERTAQKYMRIARNQDKLQEKGARLLSEAYNAVNEQSKKDYSKQYRENDKIINDDDSFEEVEDDFMDFKDSEVLAAPDTEEKPDDSLYFYWNDLKRLISGMNYTYRKLAAKRNQTTPKQLGYMIGNIREMAERLETWDPDVMGDCEECDGNNVIAVQNQHGEIEHASCPSCINGKVGIAKITKY